MKKTVNTSWLKNWLDNRPSLLIISTIATLMGAVIAANTLWLLIGDLYTSTIGWKQVEQGKIDKLSPLEPKQYFDSVLGQPVVKQKKQDLELTKYIYRENSYWVVAYVDEEDIVQHMGITACGDNGFYPKIKNNPIGGTIELAKTKMKHSDTKPNDNHYFLRGASAPSYFYDEYYKGYPSLYQTVLIGFDEYCYNVKLALHEDIRESFVLNGALSEEQTERFRLNTTITTFISSAPMADKLFNGQALSIKQTDAGIVDRKP